MSCHEEIVFFSKNYKSKGNVSDIVEENAILAEEYAEFNVANIWRNTLTILEESKRKNRDIKIKQFKNLDKAINIEKKLQNIETTIDNRLSLQYQSNNSYDLISQEDRNSLNLIATEKDLNKSVSQTQKIITIDDIYEFLQKNEEFLKLNVEFKNILFKNDCVYFKKKFLKEIEKNIFRNLSLDNSDQNEYLSNLKELTNKTVVDTLQDLINQGKIQHSFIIYSTFKSLIQVPDKILRMWSHGYLGKNNSAMIKNF